jgi:hypothetical protein
MKTKHVLCILVWMALLPGAGVSQRILTVAPDIIDNYAQNLRTAVVDGHVYVVDPTVTFLRNYNGTVVTYHSYPVRAGIQTSLFGNWWNNPIATYGGHAYMTLHNSVGRYLYRFNGSAFVSIPLPNMAASNPVFWNGRLYILTRTAIGLRLVAYNGTSVTTVLNYAVPSTAIGFRLIARGKYLYILYNADEIEMQQIVRFNGTSTLALPLMSFSETEDIIDMPGTQNIMIDPGLHHRLRHFDGTTLTTLDLESDGNFTSILPLRGAFYIQYNYESVMPRSLWKYQAGTTTRVIFPEGVQPEYLGESTVWRNEMYIPVKLPDFSNGVYKFDGTSLSHFITFPGVLVGEYHDPQSWIVKRNGNLLFIPDRIYGEYAYEYNGSTFTWIQTPSGQITNQYLGDAGCFYGWLVGNTTTYPYNFSIAKENAPGCSPLYPIVFDRFQSVDLTAYAPDRDWCWTGIDVKWKIDPACPLPPPFCPTPADFQVTLFDNPGTIVYQNSFVDPFSAQFNVDDKIARRLTLGFKEGKTYENVLMLNKALVSKGFESVSINVNPQERNFDLTVKTENNVSVPFVLVFLNRDGKPITKQALTAPLSTTIKGTVNEPVAALRIIPALSTLTSMSDYGISSISSYPNPASGKINVDIQTEEQLETLVVITLTDIYGSRVSSQTFSDGGVKQVDITGRKPGLYLLTVTAGNATKKELIQVK